MLRYYFRGGESDEIKKSADFASAGCFITIMMMMTLLLLCLVTALHKVLLSLVASIKLLLFNVELNVIN